jgi:hypothetical protein
VKVENLPEARPQWGLDHADIVFEEPVEGGITRFIVLYQCYGAPRIEPVRSARFVDLDILKPLGRILFAYSGAIQPVIDAVDSSPLLDDIGADRAGGAYTRDPTRVEPHNLETSTAALYSAAATFGYHPKPPAPYFTYGPLPEGGQRLGAVNIAFALDTTTWSWGVRSQRWFRSYSDTGRAMQGDNVQLSAANVVILHVHEYPTGYVEDPTGSHENQLVLTGSGPAWVLRNGQEFQGTWKRPTLAQPATFVESDGTQITLTPGNTWEELVPWEDAVAAAR